MAATATPRTVSVSISAVPLSRPMSFADGSTCSHVKMVRSASRLTRTLRNGCWVPDARAAGSVHADIWSGTASDLALRGSIAVFPVSGWWKDRKDRDHSARGAHYALVASIESPTEDIDLWTPVATELGLSIEVEY